MAQTRCKYRSSAKNITVFTAGPIVVIDAAHNLTWICATARGLRKKLPVRITERRSLRKKFRKKRCQIAFRSQKTAIGS
jgi:hypothetical protein